MGGTDSYRDASSEPGRLAPRQSAASPDLMSGWPTAHQVRARPATHSGTPRIGRLQPDRLSAVGPPGLELTDGAFRWPIHTLNGKQRSIDEASDGQADVHEGPDHAGPRNVLGSRVTLLRNSLRG